MAKTPEIRWLHTSKTRWVPGRLGDRLGGWVRRTSAHVLGGRGWRASTCNSRVQGGFGIRLGDGFGERLHDVD